MPTISANGLQFSYLAAGPEDGPLALLLHGFPDTAYSWSDVLPRLAERGLRAVAPFMRGYHPTAVPASGDYSVLTLGRDAVALIEALGRERAIVIGHDWGAYAAYAAASLRPDRVSKLVTVAIPHPRVVRPRYLTPRRIYRARHFFDLRRPRAAAWLGRPGSLETIYRRWSPTWAFPPAELDAIRACFAVPAAVDAALGYYRALPLLGPDKQLLAKTTVPSLTVYGADDGVADAALFEAARESFMAPHTLVAIPRAGHFVHREQPELFARELLPFLA
ncbi:MAG: alpha/beta fold hydrolase [Planctomycetota bacterium]